MNITPKMISVMRIIEGSKRGSLISPLGRGCVIRPSTKWALLTHGIIGHIPKWSDSSSGLSSKPHFILTRLGNELLRIIDLRDNATPLADKTQIRKAKSDFDVS